ncbi:MAG: fibronectin type III domain-containing protein [Bacteroides cellulosilyticus]
MKKLLIYLIPVLTFCLLNITSCKDDAEELPRLFRPSFIASSCFAEGNSITLAWRTSGEATSYTVELSRDQTFQSEPAATQTVNNGKCTFTGLRYETGYYAG